MIAKSSPRTSAISVSGNDDDDGEDRQRRAHQQPEEHEGRDLDAAERAGGDGPCDEGVLFEAVGGCEWGGIGHGGTFALARARSHPGECRVESLVHWGADWGLRRMRGGARFGDRRQRQTQPEGRP